jgi:hypothetical protein
MDALSAGNASAPQCVWPVSVAVRGLVGALGRAGGGVFLNPWEAACFWRRSYLGVFTFFFFFVYPPTSR